MTDRNILLVEDNPSDVALTRRALAKGRIGNEVVVASDGQDALDYLWGEGRYSGRNVADQPALVLLDIRLPKIDGLTVLRHLRADARTRRLPVVILTSSNEESDKAIGYDLGVNSYIRKPVDFDQFVVAVARLGLYWLVLNEVPPAGGAP